MQEAVQSRQAMDRLNTALQQHNRGALVDAERGYRALLADFPDFAAAHQLLATLQAQEGRTEEAIGSYARALAADPDNLLTLLNYSGVLVSVGRHDEGLAIIERALRLPALASREGASLHANKAVALRALGRLPEAAAAYEAVLTLAPEAKYVSGKLWSLKAHMCDWQGIEILEATIAAQLARGDDALMPFEALMIPDADLQRRCAAQWTARMFPAATSPASFQGRVAGEKIRVGYFSADFHNHATMHLIAGLFERHDRSAFEITAYAYGPRIEDHMTARLRASVDAVVDVRDLPDVDAAALARARGLDIAVDLKGATTSNRFGILAHRPAPVQIGFLGFPGTMGSPHLDYLVADRAIIPESAVGRYAEKIIWMPDSYQPTDPSSQPLSRSVTRADCGLPDAALVLCCFNQAYKITPSVFGCWMGVMRQIATSVLWLLADNAWAAGNLRREAAARGVDPERLVFADRRPVAEHLARLSLADISLDTLPYNAHTTATDALYSGVPHVALTGETFAGRVSLSLVRAAGCPELHADTLETYAALVVGIAQDPAWLAELKQRLVANRATAPLFDTARFTRNFEAALSKAHQRHLAGAPPEHIAV